MEVKIGVQHVQRELTVETDESIEALEKLVAEAVGSGAGGGGVLTLTDSKGRKVIVPVDKLAYVEIGGGALGHVGFRS